MTSGMPSLTILSEEQKFNGENLLQWNTNITQLLALKGLLGYINGKIAKPTQSTAALKATETATATANITTPICSLTPSFDEWIFRDQLTRGHITLNCIDSASLGVCHVPYFLEPSLSFSGLPVTFPPVPDHFRVFYDYSHPFRFSPLFLICSVIHPFRVFPPISAYLFVSTRFLSVFLIRIRP